MTKPELLRLVAYMDRLWLGAQLAEAMRADPEVRDSWFEILGAVDVDDARQAVRQLQIDGERRAPTPGMIARRAQELAESRRPRLAPPDQLREPTPEEREVFARGMATLRPKLAALARRRAMRLGQ